MSDLKRGKQIFEALVEYPLPKKAGVRDYIFYLMPPTDIHGRVDGYRREASHFFDLFYRNHTKKEARSLEDLISVLHADVTQDGVQQIREIVVVTHANSLALLFRILNDISFKEYKYVTDYSLALFQRELLAGKFETFKNKRKVVIDHLHDDSWVTIRGCNFGNSKNGMYATYSFFGGRANVYAPKMFMFFGIQPIKKGMRLSTRLDVYKHLLMQRFLPKQVHAPERRNIIVEALLDSAQFSTPFQLTSMHVNAPLPEGTELLSALNAGRTNDFLTSKFLEQDLELTKAARVVVVTKESEWLIKDTITLKDAIKQQTTTFQIQYQISVEKGFSNNNIETATFWVQAQLVDATSASPSIVFQLFLSQDVHDAFRGKLCVLAFFVEDPDANSRDKTKFDAIKDMLGGATSTPTPLAPTLITAFNNNPDFIKNNDNVELSPSATISVQSSPGSGSDATAWAITDQKQHYFVKLEQQISDRGFKAHTLTVFSNPDALARQAHKDKIVSTSGIDSDTPGTELAVYLDRFSIDDLVSMIDYLRTPFKPGNSFYIYHAQEALMRKKDFRKWAIAHDPVTADLLVGQATYSDLSIFEWEDKQALVYSFDFNNTWSEVKASAPSTTVIQNDLFAFAEEDLAKKLNISEADIAARIIADDQEPDSPSTDIEESRAIEKQGKERFFSTDKSLFHVPDDATTISCEEFLDVITKWQEVQNLALEEIVQVLESQKTAHGESFLDIILDIGSKYSFLRSMAKMTELLNWLKDSPRAIQELVSIPTSVLGAFKEVAKRGLKYAIKREATEVTARGGVFFVTRLGALEGLLGVLEVFPAIEIPFKMWMKVLDEQVNTDKIWERTGKLTAIRQWLRMLEDLTWLKEDNFPDNPQINVSTSLSAELYYISRYHQELWDEYKPYNIEVVPSPESLKKGFDEGADLMTKVGQELLHNADEAVSDILQASDLGHCKIKVLTDAGILDIKKLKALIVREFCQALREKIPEV